MSAIFGIIATETDSLRPEWTETMLEALRHRGPDGIQTWKDDTVALGYLALHTTPESCHERQPLEYRHWVVVADVRLDNRPDLFTLLSIPPSERRQITDSMLIAKAFEKWGKRCPEFLVGDFALAVWDRKERSLFCAKDHVGVRQLFYYHGQGYLVFATELRAIARLDWVPLALDLDGLAQCVALLEPSGEAAAGTMLGGISRLLPAHWLGWRDQKLTTRRYWQRDPANQIRFKDDREYGMALCELLQQAVDDRIRTDFPVGAMLSGGLDSSSLVCLAARRLAERGKVLYTASSALPLHHGGVEEDERPFIDSVLA